MKVKAFIHARKSGEKFLFYVAPHDESQYGFAMLIGTVDVEFDEPPHADLVNGTVAVFRKEQQRLRADCELKCENIQTQIGELLSIESKVGES